MESRKGGAANSGRNKSGARQTWTHSLAPFSCSRVRGSKSRVLLTSRSRRDTVHSLCPIGELAVLAKARAILEELESSTRTNQLRSARTGRESRTRNGKGVIARVRNAHSINAYCVPRALNIWAAKRRKCRCRIRSQRFLCSLVNKGKPVEEHDQPRKGENRKEGGDAPAAKELRKAELAAIALACEGGSSVTTTRGESEELTATGRKASTRYTNTAWKLHTIPTPKGMVAICEIRRA